MSGLQVSNLSDLSNNSALVLGLAAGSLLTYLFCQRNYKKQLKKLKAEKDKDEAEIYKKQGYLVKGWKNNTKLSNYISKYGLFEDDKNLKGIAEITKKQPMAKMLADPVCTQLMSMINMLTKSTNHLEIGVFTGYNLFQQAIQLRENAPKHYAVYALDNTYGYFFLCRHLFADSQITKEHLHFKVAPALVSLKEMTEDPDFKDKFVGKIDSIFIDANKEQYKDYYEQSMELLKPGGVLFIDNVLWSSKVVDYELDLEKYGPGSSQLDKYSNDTKCLHELNVYIQNDNRCKNIILPFGDGLLFAIKY